MPPSFLSKFVKSPANSTNSTSSGKQFDINPSSPSPTPSRPPSRSTFAASPVADSPEQSIFDNAETPTIASRRDRALSSPISPTHTRSATFSCGSESRPSSSRTNINMDHQRTQSLSAGAENHPSISTEPSTPPQQYTVIVDSPNSIQDQLSIQQQARIHDIEPDRRSLRSAGSTSNSKRSWTKRSNSSVSRKQSVNKKRAPSTGGIGGALAASGLAMANAAGAPSHQYSSPQLAPPPVPKKRTGSQTGSHSRRPSSPSRAVPSEVHISNNPYQSPHLSSGSQVIASADENQTDDDAAYDSPDLDLDVEDIPVTGFAVASNKRNADFHELFPSVPEGDYLIEDYGCALQREILIQGRLYISENHVCFHANIFGWITDLVIPMYDILNLEKKMTAFVIPNALQITTRKAKYAFASFLARDTVYDVIHNVWRLARPDVSSVDGGSTRLSVEDFNLPTRGSLEEFPLSVSRESKDAEFSSKALPSQKVTHCSCGKNGLHYPEKVMECVVPGTPDKVYTLLFASAFMKTFMREEQKLIDIQISDWSPSTSDPKLLSRNMSYIKPLSGSFGPKQTKCELRDETVHLDYEDYVSTVTTTRTPDVPSGGVFAVKTRTCIMWASTNATRVIVTSAIEWTGRSFIKAVIEKSAMDGQKQYHSDLDRHLKRYINEHITEFVPEGLVQDAQVVEETIAQATDEERPRGGDIRQSITDRRGLQWAWDTFDGAYNVGKRSANGAIELLKDAWDTSSGISLLYALVAVLVLSNIYTFFLVGRREEVGRRKAEARRSLERQAWIGDTVKVLMQELRSEPTSTSYAQLPRDYWPTDLPDGALKDISELHKALDDIERRVNRLREQLPH